MLTMSNYTLCISEMVRSKNLLEICFNSDIMSLKFKKWKKESKREGREGEGVRERERERGGEREVIIGLKILSPKSQSKQILNSDGVPDDVSGDLDLLRLSDQLRQRAHKLHRVRARHGPR